jgi:phage-related protein
MVYPSFPAIAPDFSIDRQIEAVTSDQKLGDGYTYRVKFGLHPIRDIYKIKFNVVNSDVVTISNFLETRAYDGIPFEWVTPESTDGTYALLELWSCKSWPITRDGPVRSTIDVQFERQWSYVTPTWIGTRSGLALKTKNNRILIQRISS